jgi:hypothetical protein
VTASFHSLKDVDTICQYLEFVGISLIFPVTAANYPLLERDKNCLINLLHFFSFSSLIVVFSLKSLFFRYEVTNMTTQMGKTSKMAKTMSLLPAHTHAVVDQSLACDMLVRRMCRSLPFHCSSMPCMVLRSRTLEVTCSPCN